jgi:hypothetical protein
MSHRFSPHFHNADSVKASKVRQLNIFSLNKFTVASSAPSQVQKRKILARSDEERAIFSPFDLRRIRTVFRSCHRGEPQHQSRHTFDMFRSVQSRFGHSVAPVPASSLLWRAGPCAAGTPVGT